MQIENIHHDTAIPLAYKIKTKCTKMTDESDLIKNGINGASASVATNNDRIIIKTEKVFINNSAESIICGNSNSSGIRKKCSGLIGYTSTLSNSSVVHGHGDQDDNQGVTNNNTTWTSPSSNVTDTSSASVLTTTGGSTTGLANLDVHTSQQGSFGGRLQFFKDGKFILELARTREGEKEGWVSVPRKTFWPLSTSTIVYPKNESSASLSFSDDNSSIQSSPWQRDHCWKQTNPRKNVSKEMCMFFKRTKNFTQSYFGFKASKIKRRRPYDNTVCQMPFSISNGVKELKCEDGIDAKEIKSMPNMGKTQKINGEEGKRNTRAKLTAIIQKLIDRLPTGLFYLSKTSIVGGTVHHFSSTPSRIVELYHTQQHVSPRKRILRELEKVSLEDSTNKRSRAKSSTATFSPSSHTTTCITSLQTSSQVQQNATTVANNSRTVQIANGNSTEQNTSVPTPRLYSSYSIHSLLGNATNSNNSTKDNMANQSPKEINDPSYLRTMLATPKPSEASNQIGKSTSSAFTNHTKKSPTYSSIHNSHGRTKSPLTESEQNLSRFKPVTGCVTSTSTSFHPYLSSPKYSSPNCMTANTTSENFKMKSERTTTSPSHNINTITNRRSSPQSAFTQSVQTVTGNRFNSQTSPNSSRIKHLTNDSISPRVDRKEGTPRTVPKKTAALRQQFSTSASSSSTSQTESISYSISVEQNRRCLDDRTNSPDKQLYHPGIEMDPNIGGVLRSSAISSSALYYLYSRHGAPSAHASPTPYIPPVSYYHPYAAAVAALRSPLWMHYQRGVVSTTGPPSRLGPTMFPYNGASPGPPPPLPSSLASMHLSPNSLNRWTSSSQQNLSTEHPVSLASKRDEQSSDTPLNLSKH